MGFFDKLRRKKNDDSKVHLSGALEEARVDYEKNRKLYDKLKNSKHFNGDEKVPIVYLLPVTTTRPDGAPSPDAEPELQARETPSQQQLKKKSCGRLPPQDIYDSWRFKPDVIADRYKKKQQQQQQQQKQQKATSMMEWLEASEEESRANNNA